MFVCPKTFLVVICAPYCRRKQVTLSDERMWRSSQIHLADSSSYNYTHAGETAAHDNHCRTRRRVQGRVMPSCALDDDASD